MRCKAIAILWGMLVLGSCTPGWTQEVTGNILGTLKDTSGAVVPGATITITQTDKNIVIRTLTTDDTGSYVAPLLPIGHYSVTAEARGFRKATQTNIELNVHDKLAIHFTLEIGRVEEVVTVEASALQVELQTPTAAGLISGTQVRELSLNNRNYVQLVSLMPGVSSGLTDQAYIGTTNPSGQNNLASFSINGNRNSANNWTIDGADNVDRGSNLTLLNYPSVDAIAEFKVLRGLYSAELGRSASGQVNVITKSGGSQFHGGAYEFFRNDVLAANSFINKANRPNPIPRQPLRYNNFGYTIGGPLYIPRTYNTKKDKTFFFFSQEFRRVITYGTVLALVPTAAEKAGSFTAPVCVGPPVAGCPTTTQLTSINPVAAAYIRDIFSKIPPPANPADHRMFTPLRNVFNHRQELVRFDHVFGPRLSVSGRYLNDSIPTQEPGGLFTGSGLPGVATTETNSPGRTWAVRYTATISPTLLSEGGYTYSYGAIISRPIGTIASSNSPDIQVPLPFPSTVARVPALAFTGANTPSGVTGFGPYDDFNRNHNVFWSLTKIRERHTMKVGITYHYYQKTENAAGNNAGTFNFNAGVLPPGGNVFQQVWANFLQGNVTNNFSQASVDLTPDIRAQHIEVYGQDEFRLRPNLTLSYGLRYSFFMQPIDKNNYLTNFDPLLFDPAKAPQINPATGLIVPGTGDPLNGILIANQNSRFGGKVTDANLRNFAPRVGIAWDPWGNGKTSVRAGYGIFYDAMLYGIFEQNIFSNPPYVQNITIPNTRLENPGSGVPSISAVPKTLRAIPAPSHTPYVQQWSLDVQREVMKNLVVDIGYYGNKGTHLIGAIDINMVRPGAAAAGGFPGPYTSGTPTTRLNAFRPYRGYGPINTIQAGFNSNYHSLQISVQKRFRGNSLLNAAYTWSKALTDNGTDRSSAAQNTYDIRSEYGLSPLDRRHIFTANYVYELPWFKEQQGFTGRLLGGWEISGIVTYNSGTPLTITSGVDSDPAGLGILGPSLASPRPDRTGDPNQGAPRTVDQWFNTSVFTNVPAGQLRPGNSGRGVVRGPGLGRWDFSAFKNIRIREPLRLQFRGELFNIFNHANVSTVGTVYSPTSSTFGRVQNYRDARIVQLGLKLYY